MRVLSLSVLLGVALLVPIRSAAAQAAVPNSVRPSAEQLVATARLVAPAPAPDPASPLTVAAYQDGSRRQGVALMIVGVAGILTGLIIDEPVITILSAGVGGLGLYFYVR
jgi:hypothetical protein